MQEKLFSIHSWNFASKYFPDIFFLCHPRWLTFQTSSGCVNSPPSQPHRAAWAWNRGSFSVWLTEYITMRSTQDGWEGGSQRARERDRDTRREKERQRHRRRQKERLTGLFRPRPSGDIGRRLTPASGFHNYCIHYRELPSFLFHFPLQKFNFSPLIAHIISRVQITLKTFG